MVQPHIINVAQNLVVRQISPASTDGVFPSEIDLRTALTNDSTNWIPFILNYITNDIEPLWNTTGSNINTLYLKLFREPTDIPGFSEREAIDLPPTDSEGRELHPTVSSLEYKIFNDNIQNGYLIFEEYLANDTITPPDNLDEATNIIKDLSAFEAFLIRVISSETAAVASGVDLAEVLAFFRAEGNLSIPSSIYSLEEKIPPIDTLEKFFLSPPKPNFEKVIWVMEKDTFSNSKYGPYSFKSLSLIHYFLILLGFDTVSRYLWSEGKFVSFSSDNWSKAGKDGSPDKARVRYQELMDNFEAEEVEVSGTKILISVPKNLLKFVSMLLTEAMMYYMANLDESKYIRYLVYHAGESQYYQILFSAIESAKATNGPRYANLRTTLENITIVPSIPISGPFRAWFDIQDNRNYLEDFISTAGQTVWKYWMKHRAGLSRFNVLLDYYNKLLA
jgi:hypothetical protein